MPMLKNKRDMRLICQAKSTDGTHAALHSVQLAKKRQRRKKASVLSSPALHLCKSSTLLAMVASTKAHAPTRKGTVISRETQLLIQKGDPNSGQSVGLSTGVPPHSNEMTTTLDARAATPAGGPGTAVPRQKHIRHQRPAVVAEKQTRQEVRGA